MRTGRRTQGLTLIEVLVTSALFTLLLGLVSQFFVIQSRAASLQKAINEANESTRTALSLITWDLQNAGYEVVVSNENKALESTDGGYKDAFTIRSLDESVTPPVEQMVSYNIQDDGATENDDESLYRELASSGPSVASVVAMNVLFETRSDPFETPTGSGSSKSCGSNTALPLGATGEDIENCSVNWVWQNTPERLVRQVRLQVLGRSETRVSGYTSPVQSYTFEGGSQYPTEPGFVYHFAEQTVLVPNLGR